jgi:pyruvate dehydrogenase E1 component alpha subunit
MTDQSHLKVDRLYRFYEAMVHSREIELHCTRKTGHWYPAIGEEATVVGTFAELQEDDFAAPHYRGALIVPWLRGRPLVEVLGCLHYNKTSPTRGRLVGGFTGDIARRVLPYVTMVLGPSLALGVGAALGFQRRGEPNVAVASFGDGTAGTGDFHEALNLAASLQVPVVFVCQNNQYSISTFHKRTLAGAGIADWASRYGMPSSTVDGNDVVAVADSVGAAVRRARGGGGPTLIEAVTYRRTGHFIADPAPYRDPQEVERWEEHDPILALESLLLERGAPRARLQETWSRARADIELAAAAADAAPSLKPVDVGVGEAYGIP